MAQREPSAAEALFPHLPKAERAERQQSGPRVAEALWPSLAPKAERRLSYDELKAAWHEHLWALVGIRRKP